MKQVHKILIVTPLYPPDIGGPATHVVFVEKELTLLSNRITKCYFGEVRRYPYIIRHIIFFFKILGAAYNVDTVYVLDPLGVGLPAALASIILSKHFVLRVAGDRAWETGVQKFGVTESLDEFARNKFYSFFAFPLKLGQLITAKLAHKIVVPSEYLKQIVSAWGVSAQKINVIPSVYEHEDIPDKNTMRDEFGIKGYSIVSAGRLVVWKGFKMLIELMPDILLSRGDATLTIIGDGPDRENLRELVDLLNLQDVVKFTGNVSHTEVLSRVRAADLFILNTGYEGLSHQLLEVMDMEVPIITTRVGGTPELIENGRDGILVEYNNKTELFSAVNEMFTNPLRSRLFTANAKNRLNKYDKTEVLNRLYKLL